MAYNQDIADCIAFFVFYGFIFLFIVLLCIAGIVKGCNEGKEQEYLKSRYNCNNSEYDKLDIKKFNECFINIIK